MGRIHKHGKRSLEKWLILCWLYLFNYDTTHVYDFYRWLIQTHIKIRNPINQKFKNTHQLHYQCTEFSFILLWMMQWQTTPINSNNWLKHFKNQTVLTSTNYMIKNKVLSNALLYLLYSSIWIFTSRNHTRKIIFHR